MKSFRTLFAVIALAAASAIALATDILAPAVTAVRRAAGVFRDFILGALELAHQPAAVRQPAVLLVQAKAFVLRLIKRERPVVTASWRMCPST
jgi:hypothetical protein